MLGAGVEVVVVGGQPGLGEPLSLRVGEHAGGDAGLHAQLAHTAHHGEHRFKGGAFTDLAPGPTHAEAVGTRITG